MSASDYSGSILGERVLGAHPPPSQSSELFDHSARGQFTVFSWFTRCVDSAGVTKGDHGREQTFRMTRDARDFKLQSDGML